VTIDPYNNKLHGPGRKTFSCGSTALDNYFRVQLTQDLKSSVATCFVATDDQGSIIGFYTLSAGSVDLADLPAATQRKLPRYPHPPVVRMGRLAIDQQFQRKGFGSVLLADALVHASNTGIGAFALVVDAKDGVAGAFYQHSGFIPFPSNPLTLFHPLQGLPI
jgi:GNAT superfamily N-acetyltransferase